MDLAGAGQGRGLMALRVGAAAVAVAVLAGGAWLSMVFLEMLVRGREVGPDADEMANDPLLHLEIDRATAGDVVAFTRTEGGMSPSPGDEVSEAWRSWELETTDWRTVLFAALDAADDHDISWSRLACSDASVRFGGTKDVLVGGDLVAAGVTIVISGIDAPQVRSHSRSASRATAAGRRCHLR